MKLARNILLVDDEAAWLRTLAVTLNRLVPEADIDSCVDSRQVKNRLQVGDYALVLLDLTMPFHSGEELLAMIRSDFPNTRVIIVTGVNEVDTAVRCIKKGAYDYFIKTDNVDDLGHTVRRALEVVGLERNYLYIKEKFLSRTLDTPQAFNNILTCEPQLLDQFRYLEAVSCSPEPLLMYGASGTGKSEFAKSCHTLYSPNEPFISLNLAGISSEFFEQKMCGQLYHHSNGELDAVVGLLHQVGSGVIYLNEIGALPLNAQVRLLEFLETKQYYPLGSDTAYPVKCKFVVSTQDDLRKLHQAGEFRSDLLYRLRAHKIKLPPLAARQLDIAMLINHFIALAAAEMNLPAPIQPADLAPSLAGYDFPGNLHELKGMVFDAVSRSDGIALNTSAFMEAINEHKLLTEGPQDLIIFPKVLPTLAQMNQALMDEAMSRTANNQTAAAQVLGISQSALSRRLKGH
ncbi:sigma-54-dependent transcriptional regulator [Shewanella psychromarinicola]|uniref:Sigma-54-dependent Fis family transcriptional regulator n=1 Tax=Shewanella psychromarinicola TaxID=2487742 RepID=A0A3N4E9D7_9GAMM|nr:sigma 54-interacting transcriptional regulator [Shewanella psychromarinicola]AZG34644.1 sigma-54-dependent Fis family transcriptional regulator [Shewanella psychromarinicola]MCL1083911.1 sigma 54-interacting transcriptional regulator [Shewanella psychromarinicola]RPA33568.1 sigma-54-dependent Fis family transcriptional regulator [Shewanella psychromarinicola]